MSEREARAWHHRVAAFFSPGAAGTYFHIKPAQQWTLIAFICLQGAVAVGTICLIAHFTRFPLMFPPLAPSAVILFASPLAATASPRTVILGHYLGLALGLSIAWLLSLLGHEALDPGSGLNWLRIASITLTTGLSAALMIAFNCLHPAAIGTAIIACMGLLPDWDQIFGLAFAVFLLVVEAYIFNRLFARLPYPLWAPISKDHPHHAHVGASDYTARLQRVRQVKRSKDST